MGLRRGEALGLRWSDIDFKNKTLAVLQTRQVVNRGEIFKDPKSETSKRTLVMPDFVINVLKEHKKNIVLDISHQLVCSLSTGEPLSINTFSQRWERALKRDGIGQDIRYHDLRHTCAAFLTAAGASPKEVSVYLGQSSISITMDLYADLFDTTKESTAQKLNDLISSR